MNAIIIKNEAILPNDLNGWQDKVKKQNKPEANQGCSMNDFYPSYFFQNIFEISKSLYIT